MGQPGPQLLNLLGVGGPGDGPGHGEAVLALGAGGDGLVELAHGLVDGAAVGELQVLELPGTGVGGLDQYKGALVLSAGGLQEGLDGVGAHVAVEGNAVRVKGLEHLALHRHAGEPALRVGGGGGADVTPLDVGDDKEALALGVADGALQQLHPPPAQVLIVGRLGLYRRDHVAQGVDEPHVELPDGLAAPPQVQAVLLIAGPADVLGHILNAGVQPGHGGVLGFNDLLLQYVKRHVFKFLSFYNTDARQIKRAEPVFLSPPEAIPDLPGDASKPESTQDPVRGWKPHR